MFTVEIPVHIYRSEDEQPEKQPCFARVPIEDATNEDDALAKFCERLGAVVANE